MASENSRKKIIMEARQLGGLAIPHLKLQIHQNGAKFPISRIYIDDEQLDSNTYYTIIAIPEITKRIGIALSYFHRKFGPVVFACDPADLLKEQEITSLADVMDSAYEPGYFTHQVGSIFSMNYYFEIASEWARGNKEMIMLSCIPDSKPNLLLENTISTEMKNLSESMKQIPGLYKALYKKEDNPEIEEKELSEIEKMKQILLELLTNLKTIFEKAIANMQWNNPPPIQLSSESTEKEGEKQANKLKLELNQKNVKELEEKVIQAWKHLSNAVWDEIKEKEILAWIKSGGYGILNSQKICDIKYQLVQNGMEYKAITEWRELDEKKDSELVMKILIEIHERLESKRASIHPSIWIYLKESIQTKSKAFQEKIPFTF